MIIRKPDFYDKFACIGGKCKKSCCEGWALEIDGDTYDYYMSIEGEFGDRLRSCIEKMYVSDEEDRYFSLVVDGRCPFLNKDNLCDIVLNLGEDSLCEICATYPRATFEYGQVIEFFLTPSCEEACRLLFENDKINYVEEFSDLYSDNDEDDFFSTDESIAMIDENELAERYIKIRDKCLSIIVDRNHPFNKRLEDLYKYVVEIQGEINGRPLILADLPYWRETKERIKILKDIEPINPEFVILCDKLEKASEDGTLDKAKELFEKQDSDFYNERLLGYYVTRYFPEAVYNDAYLNKLHFSHLCLLLVNDIMALHFYEKGEISKQDRLDIISDFSRQAEHSEDNMEMLMFSVL